MKYKVDETVVFVTLSEANVEEMYHLVQLMVAARDAGRKADTRYALLQKHIDGRSVFILAEENEVHYAELDSP